MPDESYAVLLDPKLVDQIRVWSNAQKIELEQKRKALKIPPNASQDEKHAFTIVKQTLEELERLIVGSLDTVLRKSPSSTTKFWSVFRKSAMLHEMLGALSKNLMSAREVHFNWLKRKLLAEIDSAEEVNIMLAKLFPVQQTSQSKQKVQQEINEQLIVDALPNIFQTPNIQSLAKEIENSPQEQIEQQLQQLAEKRETETVLTRSRR